MSLVIKKKVSLESLGEEYQHINITFRSIPVKDMPDLLQKIDEVLDDAGKILTLYAEVLSDYFIEATGDIKKEDMAELDQDSVLYCFKILTGQDIDPKVGTPLTNQSPTEATT